MGNMHLSWGNMRSSWEIGILRGGRPLQPPAAWPTLEACGGASSLVRGAAFKAVGAGLIARSVSSILMRLRQRISSGDLRRKSWPSQKHRRMQKGDATMVRLRVSIPSNIRLTAQACSITVVIALSTFVPAAPVVQDTWSRIFAGDDWEGLYSVCEAPNGDLIAAGTTRSFGAGGAGGWILRLNSTGKRSGRRLTVPKPTIAYTMPSS